MYIYYGVQYRPYGIYGLTFLFVIKAYFFEICVCLAYFNQITICDISFHFKIQNFHYRVAQSKFGHKNINDV